MEEREEREREEPGGEAIDDLEVEDDAAEKIGGGLAPPSPPSGPVPIPYPNRR